MSSGPIPLSEGQENAVKSWAADDRLWTTQETVEFNLRTFARFILILTDRSALPPSSPVADSPTLDDVRIVLRQFEMRAYRADALPPGNHSLKPTLTEWREMAQWLYDTLRCAIPTLAAKEK